jgi:hypothetical protein
VSALPVFLPWCAFRAVSLSLSLFVGNLETRGTALPVTYQRRKPMHAGQPIALFTFGACSKRKSQRWSLL